MSIFGVQSNRAPVKKKIDFCTKFSAGAKARVRIKLCLCMMA